MSRSKQIAFVVSDELHDAIKILSYSNSETISATIRKILVRELVEYGIFDPRAASTEHLSDTNEHFRPRAARQALRPAGEPA